MLYKIQEISTHEPTGHTFVLVHFWRGGVSAKPDRANDFLMQLSPTGVRVVRDSNGWLKRKADGVFVDPKTLDPAKPQPEWERENYDRDLPAEIRANIEEYWERAEGNGYSSDQTDRRIKRTEADPRGVLARSDVQALKGESQIGLGAG